MNKLELPEKLSRKIESFVSALKDIYSDQLVCVILYGSAASGEFLNKRSNLNFLAVLKDTELTTLRKAAKLVMKYPRFNPLFLTQDYISNSTDIFPIEFLDIKENYIVLEGNDILKGINIDTRNLRYQCEQELKAKLLTLKQLYLRSAKDSEFLKELLFKAINAILHISRNVLRLKGGLAPYRKEEVLKELNREFGIEVDNWQKVLDAKQDRIRLRREEIEGLFIDFTAVLEKLVDIVDKL